MKIPAFCLLMLLSIPGPYCLAGNTMWQQAQTAVDSGWVKIEKGDPAAAREKFTEALFLDDAFAPAWFGLAYANSLEGKFAPAIVQFRRTIELAPDYAQAHTNLGIVLLKSGRKDAALAPLQRALQLAPENGDANINLAVWYYEDGRYASAWRYVKAARKYGAAIKPSFLADLSRALPEPAD